MAVDIEPLLTKLTALAPHFGRAREDLEAMVSRGRAQDYKGVMQNARLVLEALLRSLITEDLKQTPGKAMLDELVSKFRQSANAGIIPTNILAHMGTVQAWGNLSAHDHAGSLADSAVKVGQEEVVASLNSMVAILSWYAEKKGLPTGAAPAPTSAPRTEASAAAKSKAPLVALGAVALLGVGVAVAFKLSQPAQGQGTLAPAVDAGAPADPFASLDVVYGVRKQPLPPLACRKADDAALLARGANELASLQLLENPSPEGAFLLAWLTFQKDRSRSPALDVALACKGFAAAINLSGKVATHEKRLADAQRAYEEAKAAAPNFLENRVDLAGVFLVTGQLDAAAKEADALIALDPDYGAGYLLRFLVKTSSGGAVADHLPELCKAVSLGSEAARAQLASRSLSCP